MSVGSKGYERQIINVSPGDISATSTDAINGSQLYGVLSAIERVRYFSVKSEEGKTDGTKNWNNDGAKQPIRLPSDRMRQQVLVRRVVFPWVIIATYLAKILLLLVQMQR